MISFYYPYWSRAVSNYYTSNFQPAIDDATVVINTGGKSYSVTNDLYAELYYFRGRSHQRLRSKNEDDPRDNNILADMTRYIDYVNSAQPHLDKERYLSDAIYVRGWSNYHLAKASFTKGNTKYANYRDAAISDFEQFKARSNDSIQKHNVQTLIDGLQQLHG